MTYRRKEIIGPHTLLLGDCREILPTLGKVDAVVTDPPYPDWLVEEFRADEFDPSMLDAVPCRQFVFWSPRAPFPLDWSGVHVWRKTGTGICSYERLFERNGQASCLVFDGNPISNPTMARFARDKWANHPTQKPVSLLVDILEMCSDARTILDPFMGSGTTIVACQKLGRIGIGIEIEERYFDIACRRVEEAMKQPDLFVQTPERQPVQEVLL